MVKSADIEEKTKNQFDEWAQTYDGCVWNLYFEKAIKYALNMIELKENSVILDLGCGTGELGLTAVQGNKIKKAVGIDLSFEMIKKANSKQRKNNISAEKLEYIIGKANEIKFPDSHFDVVFCLNSFHHYLNPNDVISEIHRVLKNDGFFILLDPFINNHLRKGWGFFLKKIFKEEHVIYYTRESIKHMLEYKKFKIIKQQSFLYFTLFTVSQNVKK